MDDSVAGRRGDCVRRASELPFALLGVEETVDGFARVLCADASACWKATRVKSHDVIRLQKELVKTFLGRDLDSIWAEQLATSDLWCFRPGNSRDVLY
ncbi:MAG: hypothetical protein GY854_29765 [Deltaproteobacteria bacterium]|nr:hypothetical protein [Deltaproteobacteria bacterium]